MKSAWFELCSEGFGELHVGREKWKLIKELVQNVFDEDVTFCKINFKKKGYWTEVFVQDDSPGGFKKLELAWTVYAYTDKRKNPLKRGRYDIGEKEAISICQEARISTTKGEVLFLPDKTREVNRKKKRKEGSEVYLKLRMTQGEIEETISKFRSFFPPEGVEFIVNGEIIPYRKPKKAIEGVFLQTEIYNEKKKGMVGTVRKTNIHVHDVLEGETGHIYEMGIPVQETGDLYHIDVQQRCPIGGQNRETLLPSFVRDVRSEVLNAMVDDIPEEAISSSLVREGMSDERVKPEVVKEVIKKKWGRKVCVFDPNDPRSAEEAILKGYHVIKGRELSKEEWKNVRGAQAVSSASALFGTSFAVGQEIPEENWTVDQRMVANYAKMVAKVGLGIDIRVCIIKSEAIARAQYGNKTLTFNHTRLGGKFWRGGVCEEVTSLIIHEISHEGGGHLTEAYLGVVTKLGARMIMEALKNPEIFKVEDWK